MAEHLIECDDHDTAQQIIIDGLKRQYDDRLLLPIPRLKTNNPEQLEKVLRQQIKNVGDRPLLWSTLGQSLMKHGEWQEASLAFRAALKQRPTPTITHGLPTRWTDCTSRKKPQRCVATV